MEVIKNTMYLWGSLLLIPFWLYTFIKSEKDSRKEIIICGILFGIAAVYIGEKYALHDYWQPNYLFSFFHFEDFLYGFFFGGIAAEIGQVVLKYKDEKRSEGRYLYFILFLVITIITFQVIEFLEINSIYLHIIPPFIIGLICILIDKNNFNVALVSGLLALLITIIFQNIILLIYPEVFSDVWLLENLSGLFFLRIPIEELLFGFSLGFGASCFYELAMGRTYVKVKSK